MLLKTTLSDCSKRNERLLGKQFLDTGQAKLAKIIRIRSDSLFLYIDLKTML